MTSHPDDDEDDEIAGDEVERVLRDGHLVPKWGVCPVCHHRLTQHVVRVEHRAEVMRCEQRPVPVRVVAPVGPSSPRAVALARRGVVRATCGAATSWCSGA